MMRYLYFIVFILLAGCSVGPEYTPPVSNVPSVWNEHTPHTKASYINGWWHDFHDPILNELIELCSHSNLNIKMAQARVKTAKAEYRVAFAQLLPNVNLDALPPDGTGFDLTQVLALSGTLEPDFFGKKRENRHRAQANLRAERAERDFSLLNLQAEIASSYLELRETQTRNNILEHNLKSNQDILIFLKSRYRAGLTNYMNIAQQNAFIETQLADLEQNKAIIMMLLHKIEILTGYPPGALSKKLLPFHPIPKLTHKISLGIPAQLLCRRPDIIAAEERVAAAHANIRVAMANLFPQITIGWLLAWQTQSIASSIFAMQDPESTFFGTFTAPLINFTLYRIVDVRKREEAIAVINYEITVLRALHEVETQYNFYQRYQASAAHLNRAVSEKKLVLKLAKDSYKKGITDFNTVLRTEEDLNRLELSYLHQIVLYQTAKINLYKALGGGINDKKIAKTSAK